MFRTAFSLFVASPGRVRPFAGGQRLAIGSQIQQQHRVFSSAEQSTQTNESVIPITPCPSRGQLELSSSKLCLQHCKRLRADKQTFDNSLSLVWLKRAELEMRKAILSFGPDLVQSPHQPMVEEHMLDLEKLCETLESTSESAPEFASDLDEKEYVHTGGALGKIVAEGILSACIRMLGKPAHVPLEYLIRRRGIYRDNDHIFFRNGAEGRKPRKVRQLQKIWAASAGRLVATYPISEFLLGAEIAFGALFQTLHSGDYKSLEPMLSEDLFATFPVENAPADLLKDVSHADTGGYEVEELYIAAMDAREISIGGEKKKVIAIDVTFMCKSYIDVAIDGTAMSVTPRDEYERVPLTLSFFSPLPWKIPGATDTANASEFQWRIATIDTEHITYLDEDSE